MRLTPWTMAVAALALPTAALAEAAKPCATPAELQSAVMFLAPDLIAGIGKQCAASLGPNAYLTRSSGSLAQRYRAASAGAWPDVQRVITRIPDLAPFRVLDEKSAQALMGEMIVAGFAKDKLAVKDCVAVDHILAALDPLPSANMAQLIGAILELGVASQKKDGKKAMDFICPTP